MSPVDRLLRAAVTVGCTWEVVAITTGKVPTISALMWRFPTATRTVAWAAVVALGTDHFVTRRWV